MKNTATVAVIIYTGLSLLAVGMFLIATISGDFSAVASIGGAVWVFILAMIILMPAVTGAVKKK
ncbi:hypothetical protein DEALK_02210 [Dehalogenimonas alkenigignens]|uniref:Uncharacterized protein n=1 Tax=Dehalogenimonas alkenigignens TaxID=1217799 RepID=A0A0W0GL67_9CHLR|nr:hypothetical protein [Dehalogenimonas alkenigignens]KTB49308.1 hypothetical protein DEALK_02210 [Dehalogenimonas alkenigignens]